MSDVMRVGVVGVGYLGRFHARIYNDMPGVELVGVADTNHETADRVASEYETRAFYDPLALLDEVDVVSVVVPTSLHRQIAVPYLEKGIHMLLEKPVASTLEDAKVIVETARKHGATLQIGHLERFNAGIMALADDVNEPRFIEAHRLGPFVERATDVDVVTDLMIHDIDIILSLVGEKLASISATGTPVLTNHVDIANARLEFVNGAVANVTASRVSRKKFRRIRVFGRNSYRAINFVDQQLEVAYPGDIPEGQNYPEIVYESHSITPSQPLDAELAHFIDAVRQGNKPLVTGEDGMEALRVAMQVAGIINKGNDS
ncbi:MAG: Gfo/Idh/MocA family oxidoreductase [Gammaproteobacteria bacterium]|nr:Gfo/Idh/MocA family oxidoreductase [Gammaproteobacteria bacterium]MDX2488348.1 Gfo/Idh/MocA family oxidoreductase [Gammaproteobacteria bacterium]